MSLSHSLYDMVTLIFGDHVVMMSLFVVSIPCHYCIAPSIDKLSNIRQPMSYVDGLPYTTKLIDKECLKTPHMR